MGGVDEGGRGEGTGLEVWERRKVRAEGKGGGAGVGGNRGVRRGWRVCGMELGCFGGVGCLLCRLLSTAVTAVVLGFASFGTT